MPGMQDKFGQILVPVEEVVEMKGGQKNLSERKFFPGYVLVEMEMTDETWHLVKNTAKVTGFIGGSAMKPTPISEKEVQNILHQIQEGVEKPKPKVLFEAGEAVRVKEGPFTDFHGNVEDVNYDKSKTQGVSFHFWPSHPCGAGFQSGRKSLKIGRHALGMRVPNFVNWGERHPRSHVPKRRVIVAKKIVGYIKLQVPAGKANPSPPIGPALGQRGLNIMEFCKAFNAATQKMEVGLPVPVVITAYADKSFTFTMKTTPATVLIKKAVGVSKGSPNRIPIR